jgi:hypothetical protein
MSAIPSSSKNFSVTVDAAHPVIDTVPSSPEVEKKLSIAIAFFIDGYGVQPNNEELLNLCNEAIADPETALYVKADAKFCKAWLLFIGEDGVQTNHAAALNLFNQVLEDANASPIKKADAKYYKAWLLYDGENDVPRNGAESLNLFNQVLEDANASLIKKADAKCHKARLLSMDIDDVQSDYEESLNLCNQVLEDANASFATKADAKYQKAWLLSNDSDGVQRNDVEALNLYNQLLEANDLRSEPILFYKACIFSHGPLNFLDQLLEDANASLVTQADAKFCKAWLLYHGEDGVKQNRTEAERLKNELRNGPKVPDGIKKHWVFWS